MLKILQTLEKIMESSSSNLSNTDLFIRINKYQKRKRLLSDAEKIKICDFIIYLAFLTCG